MTDTPSRIENPFLDFTGAPAGATVTAYHQHLDALVRGQKLHQRATADQAEQHQRYRTQVIEDMESAWRVYPELHPDNIRAQEDVATMYGGFLDAQHTVGRFGQLTKLRPTEAAARLAAMSVLGQATSLMGLVRGEIPGLNKSLDASMRLGGEYLLGNLRLLSAPDGILGFSDQFLSNNWHITRNDLVRLGLTEELPILNTPPAPLAVLAADVVHTSRQLAEVNKQQSRVVKVMAQAARRFYGYDLPIDTVPAPPMLRVLAECLVAEANDFDNAPPHVKKALAARLYVASKQSNVGSPQQLPNERARSAFKAVMTYHQTHRFDAVVKAATIAQEAVMEPKGAIHNFGRFLGLVE